MPIRTAPGHPYPLGATWDGSGVNFALFSEHAEAGRALPFRQAYGAAETVRDPHARADRFRLARLPARGAARAALRLPRVRTVGPRRRATASTRTSCCSIRTPRRSPGRSSWSDAMFGYPLDGRPDATCASIDRDSAPGMPKGVVIEPAFSWGDDRPPQTPWHETDHLRGARPRPHHAAPGRPRDRAAPTPALADHRSIRLSAAAWHHRRSS